MKKDINYKEEFSYLLKNDKNDNNLSNIF